MGFEQCVVFQRSGETDKYTLKPQQELHWISKSYKGIRVFFTSWIIHPRHSWCSQAIKTPSAQKLTRLFKTLKRQFTLSLKQAASETAAITTILSLCLAAVPALDTPQPKTKTVASNTNAHIITIPFLEFGYRINV